jgi:predicted GIY-YIG superfamily endonuclease
MKVYDVYSLMDNDGNILYFGQTTHWVNRLRQHKTTTGKFYKRDDVKLNRIMRFSSIEEAMDLEHELQCYFGVSVDYPKRTIKSSKITQNLINCVKRGIFTKTEYSVNYTKNFLFRPKNLVFNPKT